MGHDGWRQSAAFTQQALRTALRAARDTSVSVEVVVVVVVAVW